MADDTKDPPRGFVRARPIRVAFLVANNEQGQLVLDSIFADCFSRWGGRFSLICPCVHGYPSRDYQRWLRAFDADIIYSFVELAAENVKRLREDFGPAYLTIHRQVGPVTSAPEFRVELPTKPLSSLSTAIPYARAFPTSAPQPALVVDWLPSHASDRFISDNFGTFYGSFGMWPLPANLADVVRPLSVASASEVDSFYRGRSPGHETVSDANSLLRFMADNRNTFGLAQLSADATPRIDVGGGADQVFNLVVGDTFDDRVAFWNLRSRNAIYLGREVCGLVISLSRFDDATFFGSVLEFLRKRNEVWRNSGPKVVRLMSMSTERDQLVALREKLSAADKWNVYELGPAITLDGISPSAQTLEHAHRLVTGRFFDSKPEWKDFPASGRKAKPALAIPRHIADIQSGSFATGGSWALDIVLEREDNHSRYSNVSHNWFFPRRLRLHGAFLRSYDSTDGGREFRYTRGNLEGALVLFASFAAELPSINIPTDENVFRFAFQQGDAWPPMHRLERGDAAPTGPFLWSQPSDKGRYLIGALRMFGGLQNAGAILLNSYWRSVFQELGGAIGPARREQIKGSIRKKIREVKTQPSDWDEATWERLTSLVAGEAHQMRVPQTSISYDDLQRRHRPFLDNEEAMLTEQGAEQPEEWIERAKRSLKVGLQDRCLRSVFFQGYEWRCDTCFSKNWHDIAAMRPELTCPICGSHEPAPVAEPWSFRLNGFLQDALREHGLLALVWCLLELEGRARSTFFYLGPHNLWKEYPAEETTPHDHEADLVCVVDGKVHLCEVKSSSRDIAIGSLVEVAKRLRPDVVTLAVMEPASPRLSAKADEIRAALADPSIDVDLLAFRHDERWDDANLP